MQLAVLRAGDRPASARVLQIIVNSHHYKSGMEGEKRARAVQHEYESNPSATLETNREPIEHLSRNATCGGRKLHTELCHSTHDTYMTTGKRDMRHAWIPHITIVCAM